MSKLSSLPSLSTQSSEADFGGDEKKTVLTSPYLIAPCGMSPRAWAHQNCTNKDGLWAQPNDKSWMSSERYNTGTSLVVGATITPAGEKDSKKDWKDFASQATQLQEIQKSS